MAEKGIWPAYYLALGPDGRTTSGAACGRRAWASQVAEACAADGSHQFLLTAKPLNLIGGVGSPTNALAVK